MFVPPPLIRHHRPPGTKAFYLPAPPPVFVLPGHERLAQHPAAVPHRPQQSSVRCQPDVFDIVGECEGHGQYRPSHSFSMDSFVLTAFLFLILYSWELYLATILLYSFYWLDTTAPKTRTVQFLRKRVYARRHSVL